MTDPIEELVPEGGKAIDLAIAPATVLSDIHKKNPVLDLPQELEPEFLVIDARKHDARAINTWIRAYTEAEKNYSDFAPQIAIIGQVAQSAIKLPDFDKDQYDDEARWSNLNPLGFQQRPVGGTNLQFLPYYNHIFLIYNNFYVFILRVRMA